MRELAIFAAGVLVAVVGCYLYLVWIFNRNRS